MSRVTIDLKKHGKDHIHYDVSRQAAVSGDEDGPYCYQMSRIRFRDIITGGKGTPKPPRTPQQSAERGKLGKQDLSTDAGAFFVARGAPVNEVHNLMVDPYHDEPPLSA